MPLEILGWVLAGAGLFVGLWGLLKSRRLENERNTALQQSEDLRRRLEQTGVDKQELSIQLARYETQLQQSERGHREKIEALEQAERRLKDSFQAMSAEALRHNADSFMQMAQGVLAQQQEKASGDLELRKQAVSQLVAPIQQTLAQVELRIGDIEKQRVGAYQGLQEQINLLLDAQKRLQLEASHLATALKSPTTRGRWGELQLRRVVELAGMLAYCDFQEQASAASEDGKQSRPDMLVHLPGRRTIAVDAKAPLSAYIEAMETADDDKRRALLQQHAQLLRKQIQALGQKAYWQQFEGSADFVLLFLPGEAFYASALQVDPSLLEVGAENRVLIATPTTLIALLRTTAFAWRQEDISKSAEEIHSLGRELYARLADMSGHIEKLGKGLNEGVKAYNSFIGSLETRVMVSARRFHELKVNDGKKTLSDTPSIELEARKPQIAEFKS